MLEVRASGKQLWLLRKARIAEQLSTGCRGELVTRHVTRDAGV